VAGTVIAVALVMLAVAIVHRRLTLCVLRLWLVLPFALVLVIASKRSLYLDRVFLDATFPLYLLIAAAGALCWRQVGRAAVATGLTPRRVVAAGEAASPSRRRQTAPNLNAYFAGISATELRRSASGFTQAR